jgi:hypothetical protein
MVVQITRSFPPGSQVPSTLCPGVTGFHQLYYVSVSRRSLCRVLKLYHPFPNQQAHTTGALLTIDHPNEYIVRLTSLPPFSVICPGAIRPWTVLLCYADCVR